MLATPSTTDAAALSVGYWPRFWRMPWMLQAYSVFAVLASVLALVMLWPPLAVRMAPYTGWTSLNIYMFTLYFALSLPVQPRRGFVLFLVPMLSIGIVTGITAVARLASDPHAAFTAQTTNPFLRYEPLQPVVQIVVPLFWILMFLSPCVWRWSKLPADNAKSAGKVTLRDLFYWIAVVALCVALSLGLYGHVSQRLARFADNATAAAPRSIHHTPVNQSQP